MATTPADSTTGRTHIGEEARQIVESMRNTVAGGVTISLRYVVLLMVAAGCMSFAPQPFALVGMVAIALLAFDNGGRRR